MLRAVLLDWGDTLVRVPWNDEIARAGTQRGLEAIGREDLPAPEEIDGYFRERLGELFRPGADDEVNLVAIVRGCFQHLGCEVSDAELERYIEASDRYWWSRYELHPDAHRVLDALRVRGFKLAIVSNSATPRRLLDGALSEQGLSERVDVAVFSSEVGKRKPHPAIFHAALDAVAVAPGDAVFVGDRLYEDVRGAGELGMTTVQALWFRKDEHPEGSTPDFRAQTPLDILEIVDG